MDSDLDILRKARDTAKVARDRASKLHLTTDKTVKDLKDLKTKRQGSLREHMLRHNIYEKLGVQHGTFHLVHG